MADVNLVADGRVTCGEQILDRVVAHAFHQADHRGRREHALTSDVHGQQTVVDHPLHAVLQPRLNTQMSGHEIDCR